MIFKLVLLPYKTGFNVFIVSCIDGFLSSIQDTHLLAWIGSKCSIRVIVINEYHWSDKPALSKYDNTPSVQRRKKQIKDNPSITMNGQINQALKRYPLKTTINDKEGD